MMFMSSARVVRSIDFRMTLFLGVMGELAIFKGLKLRTLFSILCAAIGRRCISMPRVLRVAVTTSPSLWSPCIMSNNRSSSPCPSASRLAYGMTGWSRGTNAREISLPSGLCKV
jgi:hypothetical protein